MRRAAPLLLVVSLVLPLLLASIPLQVQAQANSYTVFGEITNQNADPIQGASILVTNQATGENMTDTSGNLGQYQVNLGNLESGWSDGDNIQIEVMFQGYTSTISFSVIGDRYQVDFSLTFTDPIAVITWSPETIFIGDTVYFSGSSSWSDENITSWEWEFGDGENATGENCTHTYDQSGEFEANMTITDEVNFWSGPTVFDVIGGVDTWVSVLSYIPTGATVSTDDQRVSFEADNSSMLMSFAHDDEDAEITLWIDYNGTIDEQEITIRVDNPVDPFSVAIIGPNTSNESIRLTAAMIGGVAPYTVVWEWGDGSRTYEIVSSHTYDDSGTYLVTVTATDDHGSEAVDTHTITITITIITDDPGEDSGGGLALTEGQKEGIGTATDYLLEIVLILFMAVIFLMVIQYFRNEIETLHLVVIALIISVVISLIFGWTELWEGLFNMF